MRPAPSRVTKPRVENRSENYSTRGEKSLGFPSLLFDFPSLLLEFPSAALEIFPFRELRLFKRLRRDSKDKSAGRLLCSRDGQGGADIILTHIVKSHLGATAAGPGMTLFASGE
jgi:hypothetical protein